MDPREGLIFNAAALAEYEDEDEDEAQNGLAQDRCEKLEIGTFPARSVHRSARSTLQERALRARFRLRIQNRDGSGSSRFYFFHSSRP